MEEVEDEDLCAEEDKDEDLCVEDEDELEYY